MNRLLSILAFFKYEEAAKFGMLFWTTGCHFSCIKEDSFIENLIIFALDLSWGGARP